MTKGSSGEDRQKEWTTADPYGMTTKTADPYGMTKKTSNGKSKKTDPRGRTSKRW